MKARDQRRLKEIDAGLRAFAQSTHPLPGIADDQRREVFLKQIIDSVHRVDYPRRLLGRPQSPRRADPGDPSMFDPIRGAVYLKSIGSFDEACWLIFLFVHLGARKSGQWRLLREIYGGLGRVPKWDWTRVGANPAAFAAWVEENETELRRPGPGRGFGNHRKFESLRHTHDVVDSYVAWVGGGHDVLFERALDEAANEDGDRRRIAFDLLYESMGAVHRFGRLAKFDYLTMVGKLDLAPIEPGSTYMEGASGPTAGAQLLFAGAKRAGWTSARLEELLLKLEAELEVGMQVLEDALCNWQKQPGKFKHFRG